MTASSAPVDADPMTAFAAWRQMLAGRLLRYRQALHRARADSNHEKIALTRVLIAAACADDQDAAQEAMTALFPETQLRDPLVIARAVSLADWCGAHGAPYRVVVPPISVSVPAFPRHPQSYRYVTEPAVYACVPGAEICPGWDYVVTPDMAVISDIGYLPIHSGHVHRPQVYSAANETVVYYAPRDCVDHSEEAIFLSSPMEGHFGHWLLDFLPRLRARAFAPGVRFAVPSTITQKQRDTLALFGLGSDDLILCDPAVRHRFARLHVCRMGSSLEPNPDHVAFVRSGLYRSAAPARPNKRLYLTRGKTATRLIANQAEMDGMLAAYGVVPVDIAELSVHEQQALMAEAELVIGSFGTNLLAIYSAPPGCGLIVLGHMPEIDPVFPPTCYVLGMDYEFILCQSAGRSHNPRHGKDHDLVVDCAQLQRSLEYFTGRQLA